MTRLTLLALLTATACNGADASKLDAKPAPTTPAPRNLVCERVRIADEKATCEPELNGDGELLTHRARVTQESKEGKRTLSCSLVDRELSVRCDGLFVVVREAAEQEQPATKPAPMKVVPAKGAKK